MKGVYFLVKCKEKQKRFTKAVKISIIDKMIFIGGVIF